MANMMQMMAKAQKFKTEMQALQERVGNTEINGEAGNGMIRCVITGKFEVRKIKIDPSVTADVEMLEDLLVVALNDARAKAEKLMGEETSKLMSDMGLPAGMGLPF